MRGRPACIFASSTPTVGTGTPLDTIGTIGLVVTINTIGTIWYNWHDLAQLARLAPNHRILFNSVLLVILEFVFCLHLFREVLWPQLERQGSRIDGGGDHHNGGDGEGDDVDKDKDDKGGDGGGEDE